MAKKKTLLDKWRAKAYDETADKGALQKLWIEYFQKEKEIYQQLLTNPDEEVKGTVKELAEKYSVDIMTMTGFLDGINGRRKETSGILEQCRFCNIQQKVLLGRTQCMDMLGSGCQESLQRQSSM